MVTAGFFNANTPFWQGVSRCADLIVLNLLFLVAAAPIVTGGAAFTALYDTAWRLLDERGGGVWRLYWQSFRANFWRATAIWAVVGTVGLAVGLGWALLPLDELVAWRVLLTMLYLLVFPYFFYLQARFDNPVSRTLRNALLIPLGRLPYAAGALAITTVLVLLIVSTVRFIPQLLPPLLLGGFGLAAYAATPLLNRSVQPWTAAPH